MVNKLKQTIDKKSLFLLTANGILGTGIFFLPALGAAYAGSASLLSWMLMSLVAVLISLYFGELIAMFPKSGGVYEYVKQAFGDFPAFLTGWVAWIVANITIAMLIVGSLIYLFPQETFLFNMTAAIIFILVFNYVSYRGINVATKMLVFFGIMTIIALLAVTLPGVHSVNMARFNFNVEPFVIILGIYFIAETFFGWETAAYLAEEVKDARKNIPKTLVITTVFIALLSLFLVFVALGNVDAGVFALQAAPLSFLAEQFYGAGLAKIFTIVVFIPLIGTAASWIVSSPRLLYAMARDRALPEYFKDVHDKYRTPKNAILFQTLVTIFVTVMALGDFYLLLALVVPLVVLMYAVVMLAVVKLRIKYPKARRPFRAPFGRAGPALIALFLLLLLGVWLTQVHNAVSIFAMGVILVVLGIPLYVMIKLYTDQAFTEKFFDRLSFFWEKTFPMFYSKKDVSQVVNKLKLKRNSVVLDFGCGSGITTRELARRTPRGTVIGVDISEKQLERALKKAGKNVIFVKGKNMKFEKNSFDAVAGVGVLEYLDRPDRHLRKIMKCLKPGGRFSFLSFGKSFGIPSPPHLSNEAKIRNIFSSTAEVHIKKERKKMTEYWFIWGKKR